MNNIKNPRLMSMIPVRNIVLSIRLRYTCRGQCQAFMVTVKVAVPVVAGTGFIGIEWKVGAPGNMLNDAIPPDTVTRLMPTIMAGVP